MGQRNKFTLLVDELIIVLDNFNEEAWNDNFRREPNIKLMRVDFEMFTFSFV